MSKKKKKSFNKKRRKIKHIRTGFNFSGIHSAKKSPLSSASTNNIVFILIIVLL